MDRFADAVNGFYDVEDQLSRYLRSRAADHFAAEREAKRSLDSRGAFEARRDRIRETFLQRIGGLPDRPDDLAVERSDVLEREGYSIELLAYESLPRFHVTANCYVPDGDGPHPGILFLCGHVDEAKADPFNQRACVELASNGFVVLVVDPIGQGERHQYRDPETGDALVGGGGGVFEHCYAGQQCFYAGATLGRFMVHDARCGLDYLLGRADVDTERVGVTGTSGGGIQAAYLALVDDRLAAAAPCCSVTDRAAWLKTGKRVDAEQVVPGAIPAGINHDDFLAALAPRPLCIGAAASDEYFPIEGVHEAVDRIRRVYDLYDARSNVDLVVADEPHCSVYEFGDEIFEWLCDALGDSSYDPHEGPAVVDETALQCTPHGSVRAAYPAERTVEDLLREYVASRYPLDRDDSRPVPEEGSGANSSVDDASLRDTIVETLALDRERCELHPRYTSRSEETGLAVDHVFFETEADPDVVVTGVLVSDPDVEASTPAIVLYEDGTEELPERREDVTTLAAEYGTVLLFDPRGVGAVRHREIPIPGWVEDYYGIYGTEFKLGYDALLLGESLFGMRVFDVLRGLEFLRSETGSDEVALVGEGVGAYHALYAAAVDGYTAALDLRGLGPGFREMATTRDYPYDPRLMVFDVVGDCDVPDVQAALDDRGVDVERTGG